MRFVASFVCLLTLFCGSSEAFADSVCPPATGDWVRQCSEASTIQFEEPTCPNGHVVLTARHLDLDQVQIDISRDPTGGFEQVNGFGISPIGNFEDFSTAASWIREPFAAVGNCLADDPTLAFVDNTTSDEQRRAGERLEEARRSGSLRDFLLPTLTGWIDVADHPRPPPASFVFSAWITLCLVFCLPLAFFSSRTASPVTDGPTAGREEWGWIGALLLATVVIRLSFMVTASPGSLELEHLGRGATGELATHVLAVLGYAVDVVPRGPQSFLGPIFLDGWVGLGDLLGWGGEIVWLRAPNLLLAAWFTLLVLRVGRVLKCRDAGRATAMLFVALPVMISTSVCQGHYFLEMVISAWFLERLVTFCVERRPVYLSLATAAGLSLWAGYICALLVAPGLLFFLVAAWRREQRALALATVLAVVVMCLPIVAAGLVATLDYAGMSVTGPVGAEDILMVEARYHHDVLAVEQRSFWSVLLFPLRTASRVLPAFSAFGLCAVGAALLWWRRSRTALLCTLLIVPVAIAETQVLLRPDNLSFILPILLFVPLWGFSSQRYRTKLRRRIVMFGFVAIAAIPALIGAWISRDDIPDTRRELEGWVSRGNAYARQRLVETRENRDKPVLFLYPAQHAHGDGDTLYYLLCEDRTNHNAVLECLSAAWAGEERAGFSVFEIHDRSVAVPARGYLSEEGSWCPDAFSLLSSPPWSQSAFYVVSSGPLRNQSASSSFPTHVRIPDGSNQLVDREVCLSAFAALECHDDDFRGRWSVSECQPLD